MLMALNTKMRRDPRTSARRRTTTGSLNPRLVHSLLRSGRTRVYLQVALGISRAEIIINLANASAIASPVALPRYQERTIPATSPTQEISITKPCDQRVFDAVPD